jgi:hypothetical protein
MVGFEDVTAEFAPEFTNLRDPLMRNFECYVNVETA